MNDGAKFSLKRLTPSHVMQPFDCGDKDLNEFCMQDSYDYLKQLIAVTYFMENEEDTVLYFSLSNDKLSAIELPKSFWRKIKGTIPREKHRKDYPAVKIGRFAVNSKYRSGQHYGSMVLNFIKEWMKNGNKTGCRFITVDAYKGAVPFYQKNNFKFMGSEEDMRYQRDLENPDSLGTYAMYYDLSRMNED